MGKKVRETPTVVYINNNSKGKEAPKNFYQNARKGRSFCIISSTEISM
jgi:hypothetical protein